MPKGKKIRLLRKELNLLDVYAIATGTTLSAGFFLMPGIAAAQAGPAMILSYIIAAIPLVPAMFSMIELATAMPRAGGVYYFLDRTLGPLFGTIGGVGTWLSLVLKVAFALIGMGAYINLFFPGFNILPVAIVIAVVLGILNIIGAGKTGKLQVVLVAGLLSILAIFIAGGLPAVQEVNFQGFFDPGFGPIFATAGLVYISYIGVTKVASLSEEVKNPERNLPLGIFLALGTAMFVYILGTTVMAGVLPIGELAGDLTPAASAAKKFFGNTGVYLISMAALMAFLSVANAGIMSASRYPLALSRDHMLPIRFRRLGKSGTPVIAIVLTVAVIIGFILLFDPTKIAKLASAFQLLMFALVCLAVIVMRESRIESYDPGFKSPLYPWIQLFGIGASFWLIVEMGTLSILFSVGLLGAAAGWYFYYAKEKVSRTGAIYHIFERLGKSRYEGLDRELRGILKEKGLREMDPFDRVVMKSKVIDIKKRSEFEEVVQEASMWFSRYAGHSASEIKKEIMDGTLIGATPVTHGVALPHLRVEGLEEPKMVIVRARAGVHIKFNNPLTDHDEESQIINAIFFLLSPEKDPGQHLRMLAQIAGRVDEETFAQDWDDAPDENAIRKTILRHEHWSSLVIRENGDTAGMAGKRVRELNLPEGCLIVLVRRAAENIFPKGNTVIYDGDRLTIVGNPDSLNELKKGYPNETE